MDGYIKTNHELCTGCNRCVRECPMETANITYQDEAGNIKVEIDYEKCITCGSCVSACKHKARYFEDDTQRFFRDLRDGVRLSVMTAPSIRTNVPEYKRLFTYLKELGVNKIYDVSLGADICTWAYVRYMENQAYAPVISQPCPVIVNYCEKYRHDLLPRLAPVHSPMACASIYIREYCGGDDTIAALSPCIAKADEFEETRLAQYNITFQRLLSYLEENHIRLPEEETDFDYHENGFGALFSMPGGLKENLEAYAGKKIHITKAEGAGVFEKLNLYAQTQEDFLPDVFDVLNCAEGCNMGSACTLNRSVFEVDKTMNLVRTKADQERNQESAGSFYSDFDDTFTLSHFLREYNPKPLEFPVITDADIEHAFQLLGKTDEEMRSVDCGACGSATCRHMARKIALNVNIPINCIVKSMEDAKLEHAQNVLANEQLAKMEEAREADDRLRLIINAIPSVSILFDSSFRVLDCNTSAYELLGFPSKEALLTGFTERVRESLPPLLSNGQPSSTLAKRLATAAQEGHVRFETELILEGNIRILDVEMKRVPYEDSFAIVTSVFDLTEVREREMELARTKDLNEVQLTKLNLMIRAAKIGLWDMEIQSDDPLDPEHTIVWSSEFRSLLGYTDEKDFPNRIDSFINCMHPEDAEKLSEALMKHLQDKTGRTAFSIEVRLRKKDGQFSYFLSTGETIRDEEGNPLRSAGALMDVTETRRLIQEIERQRIEAESANRAKSSFLSTMSHEIRTPMNAILGITEIQLQDQNLNPAMKEAFDKIYSSGDLLLGIINDILDLSKIEAGKLELLDAPYEIASLISDTAQLNMMRAGSKPIEFELQVGENIPAQLSGDELRVKQILNNLLSNAFKYTAKGKVILTVTAEESSRREEEVVLVFRVSDTGQGMTETQISQLFDEYARFNQEANRTTEGTGLGMGITRNLIHLMDGEIHVASELGKGSVFTVHLPQRILGSAVLGKESAENLRQFRTSSRAQMRRVQISHEPMPYGSVLIVDDVETNIYVARGLMSPYGLKTDAADSGAAAIEKIQAGYTYDIIFMDHMMPGMDGVEATRIIRSLGYTQPIVALTANAVSGQAEMFLSNGFNDFISKPIDIRQLNVVLNKLVRDKQPAEVVEAARRQSEAAREESSSAPTPAIDARFAEAFVRDASKVLAILEEIVAKDDYGDDESLRAYVINVHGIKSALANVGMMELSNTAKDLESWAREGQIMAIREATPAFLLALRDFTREIVPRESAARGDGSAGDAEKEISAGKADDLEKELLTIKAACEQYDESAAEKSLAALRAQGWSTEIKALLDVIAEQLLHSDFDEIAEAISRFISGS